MTVDGFEDVQVWCRNCEAPTDHHMCGMEMVCKDCAGISVAFHPRKADMTSDEVLDWLKQRSDRR